MTYLNPRPFASHDLPRQWRSVWSCLAVPNDRGEIEYTPAEQALVSQIDDAARLAREVC